MTFKEVIGSVFVFFGALDKKKCNLKIFDKMSIELSTTIKKEFENPFDILNMGLPEQNRLDIDEKKDQLRKRIDSKISKGLREIFYHYSKGKNNIDVAKFDEYDRLYKDDFLKFAKEFDLWTINKSNNTKDINKNKDVLTRIFLTNAKEHGSTNHISQDVFK